MRKLRFGFILPLVLLSTGALITPVGALELKFSGQVNQMIMYADNGNKSEFFVTDNDSSGTRVRFTGEETFGAVKAGAVLELDAQKNASNTLDIGNNSDGTFEWKERILNAYFTTEFGQIEIGQGDGAANGTSEVDLSGTTVIIYSDTTTTNGGFTWKNNDGSDYRGADHRRHTQQFRRPEPQPAVALQHARLRRVHSFRIHHQRRRLGIGRPLLPPISTASWRPPSAMWTARAAAIPITPSWALLFPGSCPLD